MRKTLIFILISLSLQANDLVPGKMPKTAVAIIHAKIYTVSGPVIDNGILVFKQGKILAVGRNVQIPEKALIIDARNGRLYPGLIAGRTNSGLIEIGAVRATRDNRETGIFNPNVRAETAYNTGSEVIPTLRSMGLTAALVTPDGGLISGMGALMFMDGWNKNDARIKSDAALVLNWPVTRLRPGSKTRIEKQRKKINDQRRQLNSFFDEAEAYRKARNAGIKTAFDIRFESMIPVLNGQIPLLIRANDLQQIHQAVRFCTQRGLKMILLEGADSWRALSLLHQHHIPVILRQPHSLPTHIDEDYDQSFKTPAMLARAGIPFGLTKVGFDNWDIRNLPFWGATMVSFGLSRENALKSMTLWPAQIYGVSDRLGSLEPGKNATLFISRGDVMDYDGNEVTHMFINGKPVDLDNKQKRLYRKYKQRP